MPHGSGIGKLAEEALMKGMTNKRALAVVRKKFPEAGTSLDNIRTYRSRLRCGGAKVSTNREAATQLRRQGKEAQPQSTMVTVGRKASRRRATGLDHPAIG
jgi:hypothetical protein